MLSRIRKSKIGHLTEMVGDYSTDKTLAVKLEEEEERRLDDDAVWYKPIVFVSVQGVQIT